MLTSPPLSGMSQSGQYVWVSRKGLSSQIFVREQIINRDDKLCDFVYGFQKAIQPPLLSLSLFTANWQWGVLIPAGLIRLEVALHKGFVQRFSPLTNVWRCEAEPQTHTDADHHAAGDVYVDLCILVFAEEVNHKSGVGGAAISAERYNRERDNKRGGISHDITLQYWRQREHR